MVKHNNEKVDEGKKQRQDGWNMSKYFMDENKFFPGKDYKRAVAASKHALNLCSANKKNLVS